MKIQMKILKTASLVLMSALAGQVSAGHADIYPVFIEHLSVIAIPSGGHLAGNFEVKIKGGFSLSNGVICDPNYITTLKSVDIDKRLFSLLTVAHSTKQAVQLRITDDPNFTAFAGRCSLVWVNLIQ